MTDTVISVEHLSKHYRLGTLGGHTLRADLARAWARLRGQPVPLRQIGQEHHGNHHGETIWALRDVSFEGVPAADKLVLSYSDKQRQGCEEHSCLPPLTRFDLDVVLSLMAQKKYFVLHAPRQTGQTSSLLALRDSLHRQGKSRCLYTTVEMGQAAREDVQEGMRAGLWEIASRARDCLHDHSLMECRQDVLGQSGPHSVLKARLTLWAEANVKPMVLLMDESDSLVGATLISVWRQWRAGYEKRPALSPQSRGRDHRMGYVTGQATLDMIGNSV